jgi:hypothetical protein
MRSETIHEMTRNDTKEPLCSCDFVSFRGSLFSSDRDNALDELRVVGQEADF